MTADELNTILTKHFAWLRYEPDGVRANLTCANLTCANLTDANLRGANLRRANLRRANLTGANLTCANLTGANLPHFQIPPESGGFTGYKKCCDGKIVTLYIPARARRTSSLVGRKCRAEFAKVISIIDADGKPCDTAESKHDGAVVYRVGEIVRPDSYDDDIRVECTHGIHFFITRREAEEYSL